MVERVGRDDDIHFRNEERKKKKQDWVRGVVVMKGGRKSGSGREEEEGKKLPRLAPIKAGGGGQRVFFFSVVALTPGSGSDRRVVYANEDGARVFMCPCALSRGPSVSVSQGRGEDVGEGPRGS